MKIQSEHIIATTLDDSWYQLLYNIDKIGRKYKIDEGSYAGHFRLEYDYISGIINIPHERPLAPRVPEGSGLPIPTDDNAIEQYFANYLMDPNLKPGEEYRYSTWINGQMLSFPKYCRYIKCKYFEEKPIYIDEEGKLQEPFFCQGMDVIKFNHCPIGKPNTQLEWVIDHFKNKGYGNNHCYISVGDKFSCLAYERPYSNETERGTSPCLRGLDFKIKNDQLILGINFRSWDLYSGFPENMGGFVLLNEYVANELAVEPGPLTFSSNGLHCYDFQLEILKQRLGK